jgi:hypothetical protein
MSDIFPTSNGGAKRTGEDAGMAAGNILVPHVDRIASGRHSGSYRSPQERRNEIATNWAKRPLTKRGEKHLLQP